MHCALAAPKTLAHAGGPPNGSTCLRVQLEWNLPPGYMNIGARVKQHPEVGVTAGDGQDLAQPWEQVHRKVRWQRTRLVGCLRLYGVHHSHKLRHVHAKPLVEERVDGCVTNLGTVFGGSEQAFAQRLEAAVSGPSRRPDRRRSWSRRNRWLRRNARPAGRWHTQCRLQRALRWRSGLLLLTLSCVVLRELGVENIAPLHPTLPRWLTLHAHRRLRSRRSWKAQKVGVEVCTKHSLRVLHRLAVAAEEVDTERRSGGPVDDARHTVTQEFLVRVDIPALEARLRVVSHVHFDWRNSLQNARQLLPRLRSCFCDEGLRTRLVAPAT